MSLADQPGRRLLVLRPPPFNGSALPIAARLPTWHAMMAWLKKPTDTLCTVIRPIPTVVEEEEENTVARRANALQPARLSGTLLTQQPLVW